MSDDIVWKIIGIIAASLTMFGFVPQSIKMWKKGSAKDVSGASLVQFTLGSALWLLYGMHIGDLIVIGANAVSLGSLLLTLGLYVKLNR